MTAGVGGRRGADHGTQGGYPPRASLGRNYVEPVARSAGPTWLYLPRG